MQLAKMVMKLGRGNRSNPVGFNHREDAQGKAIFVFTSPLLSPDCGPFPMPLACCAACARARGKAVVDAEKTRM